jgi:hypothetical protein
MKENKNYLFIKNIVIRSIIVFFDLLLASTYLAVFLIQKIPLYRRIGSDRLKITNQFTTLLSSFFDPKTYYVFYEKIFYEKFLNSSKITSPPKSLTSIDMLKRLRPDDIDVFNRFWSELFPGKEIDRGSYAFLYSLFEQPPKKVYLYNVPESFVEVVTFAQKVLIQEFCLKFDVIDLNLFSIKNGHDQFQGHKPFHEIASGIVENFESQDFFVFGLADPIPPLGHVRNVFVDIFPEVRNGMRIGVYGVSDNSKLDEWIIWNLSFWNAETLLEVLLSNSKDLVSEWDSRLLDLSREGYLIKRLNESSLLVGTELIVIRKVESGTNNGF